MSDKSSVSGVLLNRLSERIVDRLPMFGLYAPCSGIGVFVGLEPGSGLISGGDGTIGNCIPGDNCIPGVLNMLL